MLGSTIDICNHTFLPRFVGSKSVIVDLGANHGDFSQAMMEKFKCKVVAVEPVKALYDEIQSNQEIQRYALLNLLPIAVGGTNGTIEINVYDGRCASVLGAIRAEEGQSTQKVEMVTLAELRKRTGVGQIDLLKMDIEGAEIDLLNGCSDEELQSVMQMTVEFHEFLYPEQAEPVARIIARMRVLGFWVMPFSLDTTNVLFVNKKTGVGAGEFAVLRTFVRYGKGIVRRARKTFGKNT